MAKRNIAPKPIRPLSQKDIDRFWSKVDRRGPDECWPWLGGKTSDGYGRFKYGRCEYKAIRVAYYLQTGKLPDTGMSILHSCDFPACQNAAHLREGTTRENMKDRDERGRTAKGDRSGSRLHPQSSIFVTRNPQKLNPPIGSKHPRATLTEKDIPPIRMRHARGERTVDIALSLGVSKHVIYDIIRGKNWTHVPREPIQLDLF
jgi:hypothetical protein